MADVASELDRAALLAHFDEHTLPDGRIGPTDLRGWRRVLQSFQESGWRIEDAPVAEADLSRLFDPETEWPTIKVFVGHRQIQVNVFPLEPTSIDFDFATEQMTDQEAVDLLASFIRSVATAADGDCELTPEGSGCDVVARYGREVNRFAVIGDRRGRLDDAVWNRAALGGGHGAPGPGDHALSSALVAHGLIANGGVAHAVLDAMVAGEIEAAIDGFQYLGLNRAASVIEAATALSWSDADEALDRLDRSYWLAVPSDGRIADAAALRHATSAGAFAP